MRKVLTIAIAEFEQAVRSRAFIIGLLALPLLMSAAFFIQAMTARRDTSERRFAIVDRTGVVAAALVAAAGTHNEEMRTPQGRLTGPQFLPEVVPAGGQAQALYNSLD